MSFTGPGHRFAPATEVLSYGTSHLGISHHWTSAHAPVTLAPSSLTELVLRRA